MNVDGNRALLCGNAYWRHNAVRRRHTGNDVLQPSPGIVTSYNEVTKLVIYIGYQLQLQAYA